MPQNQLPISVSAEIWLLAAIVALASNMRDFRVFRAAASAALAHLSPAGVDRPSYRLLACGVRHTNRRSRFGLSCRT